MDLLEAGCELTRGIRELIAQSSLSDDNATINAGCCRPRLLTRLEANVVQQCRFGEGGFRDGVGVVNADPPAEEVQQVEGIASKRGLSQTPNTLTIEEPVDPGHLTSGFLLDDAKRTLRWSYGVVVNEMKGHGSAASRRR